MSSNDDRTKTVRGIEIPSVGLGTWQLEGSECVDAVVHALDIGYRHIDTAEAYENEAAVGEGLRKSGVPRDEIWITTKVWWKHLDHDACLQSARRSLERLGLDSVDLLLIHWPDDEGRIDDALSAMLELKEAGDIRHLGVSNFTPELLESALDTAPILCNQVEYHPFLAQKRLLELCEEHDLLLTAYSPLAQGKVTDDPTLRRIGARYDKTASQVALRWLIQQPRVAAIPRSSSKQHRAENLDVFDFSLTDQEMHDIGELDEGLRLIDPDFAPDWSRAGADA